MVQFFEAVLILMGMIIGVGMFSIPFTFYHAGFFLGAIELVILAGAILVFHLLYAEIVLATPGYHRLPGYVEKYLGHGPAALAWFSSVFGISGILLVYILFAGTFLNVVLSSFWHGSNELFTTSLVLLIGACMLLLPLRREAVIGGILTSSLVFFILFLIAFLLPRIDIANITGFHISEAFVPYGILLFALSGGIVIPDLISLLRRDRDRSRKAILVGTLIPAILYFFFALAVVGVLGDKVTPETIMGLRHIEGNSILLIGSIIGFLGAFTSFIVLGKSFQALLKLDFQFSSSLAWGATILLPLMWYAIGFKHFLPIIAFIGTISVGIDSALILMMYQVLHGKNRKGGGVFSYVWKIALFLMIIIGVSYELYHLAIAGS